MKAKPEQLSILSNLIQVNRDAEGWVLTAKVVRSLLVSLAHHEAYHALFNKFIQENPLILEEKEYGFLKHCMGLLDYRNKLTWIQRKFATLIENARIAAVPLLSLVSLPRSSPEGILAFVHKTFCNTSPLSYWKSSLTVTFENEAGICTGPRREFWDLYCQELLSGKDKLFTSCNNGHAIYLE
jgi:hypothetical protein